MVLELLSGGEFFSFLQSCGRLPEEVARFYSASVLSAFEELHRHLIAYRDLKPENMVTIRETVALSNSTHRTSCHLMSPQLAASAGAGQQGIREAGGPRTRQTDRRWNHVVGTCTALQRHSTWSAELSVCRHCVCYELLCRTMAGTPEYLAPEIVLNKGHNHAVDYWALVSPQLAP
jgi:serine/threonine protein kinase